MRRWRRPPRRERAGGCERRGGAARRLRRAPPPQAPPPRPSPPSPLTPPSSALCAIAHLVLEARVGPRLEQRLDAGRVAVEGRDVQRRPLVLPRRGGGRTHAGGAAAAGGRVVSEGGGRGADGGWGGDGRALTLLIASSLAPLATRCSRQSRLPLAAARMRAVSPSCGGAAAAPHAVSGGGEARGSRGGGRRGRRARGAEGWRGRRSPRLSPRGPPPPPRGA